MRVSAGAILDALQARVEAVYPGAEHYRGRLEEGFSAPAFSYFLFYQGERKANAATTKRDIEIQLVYHGKTDKYGRENIRERERMQTALEGFLCRFYLEVGDRRLGFRYEWKETEERLALYLTFSFLDEAPGGMEAELAAYIDIETKITGK